MTTNPDMQAIADPGKAEYEALGIFEDTWTCVAVMDLSDAKAYLWSLAKDGIPAKVSHDPDGKRWHVAIQGGLRKNPAAVFITYRGDAISEPPACTISRGQHPQAPRS